MGRSTQPAKKTVDGETNEREVVRVASNQLKLKLDNLRTFQPLTNNQKKFFNLFNEAIVSSFSCEFLTNIGIILFLFFLWNLDNIPQKPSFYKAEGL